MDAILEIELYLRDVSYEQFLENSEKRFATIKQIEIIGEACNALSDELKSRYPLVPLETDNKVQEYFHSRIFWYKPAVGLGNSHE